MIDETTFSDAYSAGYAHTVRFLASKGDKDPDDHAQEAWLRAWANRESFRGGSRIQTWVNMIALNVLRTSFRRKNCRPVEEPLLNQSAFGLPQTEAIQAGIDVPRILERLREPDQEALRERYLLEYSHKEMAERYGKTVAATKSTIYKAKEAAKAAAA